jgi:hypothetical protein
MIRRLLPAIALLVLCLTAAPRPVAAYEFFKGGCNADTANSVACQSQPQTDANGNPIDPLVGPDGLLAHITNIVTIVAGAAAVILIIVSALKLITSGSDVSTGSRTDTDIEDARRALANAVIGLVVIVAARTIIVYLLNRL